ncbi:MAG TPA: hypothetical protein VH601_20010 [Bryobacteraceae bacterium]|jgi:hypothetical protein
MGACHATASFPFQADVFPFGFLLRIKSNHRGVIEIARETWSCFAPEFSAQPLELHFIVSEANAALCKPGTPPDAVFRAQNNLLVAVADAHNSALCDLRAGFGFAHLSETAVLDKNYLRYTFLEAIAYTLLDAQHVVAVHAACVAKNGSGFLLFGESGAGKSSLAYACARQGWTYISDDCAFLLRRASGRVATGNPRTFRFRPAASTLFPEVKGPVSLRNGKHTIEIESAALPSIKTAAECTVNHVIFLNRCVQPDLRPLLRPVSQQECWRRISQQNAWPAELCIEAEREDVLKSLLGARALQLNYAHCAQAIEALDELAYT